MPKILIQNNQKIEFIKNSARIINHYENSNGKIYFTYEIKFNTSESKLNEQLFVGASFTNPIEKQQSMFSKNKNQATKTALDEIKDFDSKRFASLNSKEKSYVMKKSIDSNALKQKIIQFDIEYTNSSYRNMFIFVYVQHGNVQEILASITIDTSELIKWYELPYSDFNIHTDIVKNHMRRIIVKSNDKRIKKFIIFTNEYYGANDSQKDTSLKTQEMIVKNNIASIDLFEKSSTAKQYRIVPVSFLNDTMLSQYNAVDVNQTELNNADCIIYPINVSSNNAIICITSLPKNCITAYLVRKNLTQKELLYSIINFATTRSAETIQFEDMTINAYNSYDYRVIFEMYDGSKMTSTANCVIRPQLLNEIAILTVDQTNETIENNNIARTFSVSVEYTQSSSTSKIVNDLKKLGIDNLFQNEIKNLSTQLDPLIGIFVTKTNITLGTEERIGIFEKGEIKLTDSTNYDIVYRFEICLKTVPDMIEEIGTSSDFVNYNDSNRLTVSSNVLTMRAFDNKENFTQKFYSKKMQETGALQYGKTKNSNTTGVESGRTNIFQTLFYKNRKKQPTIVSTRILDKGNGTILSWNASNLDSVDKFEIHNSKGRIANCIADTNIDTYYATTRESINEKYLVKAVLKSGGTIIKEFENET